MKDAERITILTSVRDLLSMSIQMLDTDTCYGGRDSIGRQFNIALFAQANSHIELAKEYLNKVEPWELLGN
jgi:hypothetical protein